MSFIVIVHTEAVADVADIGASMELNDPSYASRWVAEVERAIQDLGTMPNRHPLAPESAKCTYTISHVLAGMYRVIFAVRGNEIHVMRVRHAARRPFKPGELD